LKRSKIESRNKSNSFRVVKTITADAPLTALAFMEDGFRIVVGTSSGKIHVFDLKAGTQPVITLNAHPPFSVNYLQFQNPVAVAKAPAKVRICEGDSIFEIRRLQS
jgi:hypothetical protein